MDLRCEAFDAYEEWSRYGGIEDLDLRDAFIAGYERRAKADGCETPNVINYDEAE